AAALQFERQPVDGLDEPVVGREVDLQVADREERRGSLAGALGLRGGRGAGHQASLTLGSTMAYRRSTIRLITTIEVEVTRVTPSTMGRSPDRIESIARRPRPGMPKVLSVRTAPPS